MSITVSERFQSRRGTGDGYEFLYQVITDDPDTDTETEMRAAMVAASPDDYEDKSRQGITEWEQQSNTLWFGTVTYSNNEVRALEGSGSSLRQRVRYSTAGGTQHVTQSLETMGRFAVNPLNDETDDAFARDFKGAIGVGADGDVTGVDIGVGSFDFVVELHIPKSEVTIDVIRAHFELAFHTNAETFSVTFFEGVSSADLVIDFEEGEVLFTGCTDASEDGDYLNFTLGFSALPNISGSSEALSVGDITIEEKKGWDHLWVFYGPDVWEGTGDFKAKVVKPASAYVERVFDPGDFDRLLVA